MKKIDVIIRKIIKIALEYEKTTGRRLGVTAELGEQIVARELNITLAENQIMAGFDARDARGKRYQIKAKRILRHEGRMGSFAKHPFDYAVLVLFDGQYNVSGIWKMTYKQLSARLSSLPRRNPPVVWFKTRASKIR